MPGSIDRVEPGAVSGWARHPQHEAYAMTVHAVADGRVIATVLADLPYAPHVLGGFMLALPCQTEAARVQVLLGETDELLEVARPRRRVVTVEDLVGTPVRRAWVHGACYLDAARAGLSNETIIDLLCRDFLGRPAGPVVIATATSQLAQGGYDAVRRMLLAASEYRYRRIHADHAPGAIFSQRLVMQAAAGDWTPHAHRALPETVISATPLLALDADAFVHACYRQILRKEVDRAGLSHYLQQMEAGVSKAAIIAHLGREFETISAGITIVDLPEPG